MGARYRLLVLNKIGVVIITDHLLQQSEECQEFFLLLI